MLTKQVVPEALLSPAHDMGRVLRTCIHAHHRVIGIYIQRHEQYVWSRHRSERSPITNPVSIRQLGASDMV